MGLLFIPKEVMDVFTEAEEDYYCTVDIQIRENSSSRTRYYTNTLTP